MASGSSTAEAKHVLVVDDDFALRVLIERILTKAGHRVEGAGDAEEALVLLGKAPFDVLVVDKHLPGMDGFTLAKRALERSPSLAVVMVTAAADRLNSAEAELLDVYLGKPFKSILDVPDAVGRASTIRADKVARQETQRRIDELRASLHGLRR